MKKYIIILIVTIVLIATAVCTLYLIDQNRMKNNQEVLFSTWGKDYTPVIEDNEVEVEHEEPEKEEEKEPEYKDENPVKLGIYVENGDTKDLVTEDYYCNWDMSNVMGLFYAVPTQEESISNYNFDTLWKEYINKYPNPDKYRIGYNVKFTFENDEVVDMIIRNPSEAYFMFPMLWVYLYDDVNLVPGAPYYHIENMYDYTICSSFKIVGGGDTYKIKSDIELTAFCFDSDDDFDPETGKYRGNSYYTITIKRY